MIYLFRELTFTWLRHPSLSLQGFDKLKEVVDKWAESPAAAWRTASLYKWRYSQHNFGWETILCDKLRTLRINEERWNLPTPLTKCSRKFGWMCFVCLSRWVIENFVYFEGNLCRVENKFLTKLNLRINKLEQVCSEFRHCCCGKGLGGLVAFESSSW
jgi:hypothetical protein